MTYTSLLEMYFERSNALQWYWTIYVVVIGGLLAVASMRKEPDTVTTLLVTVLFCFFAYKNCGAIGDVTAQRLEVFAALKSEGDRSAALAAAGHAPTADRRIEAALNPPAFEGVRNFHIASDVLTVAALWAMEMRRRRVKRAG
ncbi:MAG TPA: hypothetical protein VFF65_05365 [Phycisphaerales bacterium]|nr:hypothetical protein [Phycisphaerales bacterium]